MGDNDNKLCLSNSSGPVRIRHLRQLLRKFRLLRNAWAHGDCALMVLDLGFGFRVQGLWVQPGSGLGFGVQGLGMFRLYGLGLEVHCHPYI